MNPPVTIVLPVHNGMPYVDETVRSILAQSWRDFELLIGDDGSDDGSSALLAGFAERDPRIRLVRRESKSGLSASQNWLVRQASAPLIAIANADDLSHPERVRRQLEIFRAEPDVDLVGTLWEGVDEDGRLVRPADYWRLVRRSPFAPFSHSSAMFRRSAYDRVGGFRPEAEYWEDHDLYLRIADGGRIVVIPEVLATVRHARISTRLRNDQDWVEDAVDLMYRSTACYKRGGDHSALLEKERERPRRGKLHPLTFISCGSTLLWTGRSPAVFERMMARADFGPNLASLQAFVWASWGTLSPRSLRLFLRLLLRVRSAVARTLLGAPNWVDWRPRERQQAQGGQQRRLSPQRP